MKKEVKGHSRIIPGHRLTFEDICMNQARLTFMLRRSLSLPYPVANMKCVVRVTRVSIQDPELGQVMYHE